MKLTKLQRHTAYVVLLYEVEKQRKTPYGLFGGFCLWISQTFDFNRGMADAYDAFFIKETFPELYNKADWRGPKGNLISWSSWDKRISDLKQCIKETA